MGSPCIVHAYHTSETHLKQAVELAMTEVIRLEQKYSRYRDDSILSKINSSQEPVFVDAETAGLLNYSKACYELSEGLFDITSGIFRNIWDFRQSKIPSETEIELIKSRVGFDKILWDGERIQLPNDMEIDFGGVVKEYAADQARNVLKAQGIENGLVDLGGDMSVVGTKPDGTPWTIGVRNPDQPEKPIVTIPLSTGAIATSGYYERFIMINGERYCHIINPKTGWPVKNVATVSVVSDECLVSGSLTTVAMLKEKEGASWLEEQGATYFLQTDTGEQFGSIT